MPFYRWMKLFSSLLVASIALFVALSVRGADYPTSLPYGRSVLDYCGLGTTNLSVVFSQDSGLNIEISRSVTNKTFAELSSMAGSLVKSAAKQTLTNSNFNPDEPIHGFVNGAGPSLFSMVYWDLGWFMAEKNSEGNYVFPSNILYRTAMRQGDYVPLWIEGLAWVILDAKIKDGGTRSYDSRNLEQQAPAQIISGVLYVDGIYFLTGANGYSDTTITLGFSDGTVQTYASPIPKLVLRKDGVIVVTDLELDDFVIVEFSRDLLYWETLTELYFDGSNNSVDTTPNDVPTFYRLNPYR